MYTFSLGVGKPFKEFLLNMLSDSNRTTSFVLTLQFRKKNVQTNMKGGEKPA